jgi:hypothetical protein
MREHKGQDRKHDAEATSTPDQLDPQMARELVRRHNARQTRTMMRDHVHKAIEAMMLGCNLFQMAVRGIDEKKLQEKLEVNVAEQVKDKLVDKLSEKFREGVVEASDLGKEVASRSLGVFSSVKGQLSDHIKAQKDLTLLQVADTVTAALIDKAKVLEDRLVAAVDTMPRATVLSIRGMLQKFKGVTDAADGPEEGNLIDGLQAWALQEVGLPAADNVAAEQYAVAAFAEFQMGVISTMPAHEAGDAIQKRLDNPAGDQEAVEGAEGQMGQKFQGDLKRDRALRARVEAT